MSAPDRHANLCRCIGDAARAALARILTLTSGGQKLWDSGTRELGRELGRSLWATRALVEELRTEPGLWLAGEDAAHGKTSILAVCGPSMCRWECGGLALCEALAVRPKKGPSRISVAEIEVRHGFESARVTREPGARVSRAGCAGEPRTTARVSRAHNSGYTEDSDIYSERGAGFSACGRSGCTALNPCRICRKKIRPWIPQPNPGTEGNGQGRG